MPQDPEAVANTNLLAFRAQIATDGTVPDSQVSRPYANLANGTTAMGFGALRGVRVTPTGNATFTTTVPALGTACYLLILTAGASSFTITFGSGFKPTGTLATGTTAARVFVLQWVSDGTNLYEVSRTVAMPA